MEKKNDSFRLQRLHKVASRHEGLLLKVKTYGLVTQSVNVFARRCNKLRFPDCLAVVGFVLSLHVSQLSFSFVFRGQDSLVGRSSGLS